MRDSPGQVTAALTFHSRFVMRSLHILTAWCCAAAAALAAPLSPASGPLRVAAAGAAGDIVLSRRAGSELVLLRQGAERTLARSPGSGLYPALSADMSRIGFKLITPLGLQAPATVDLSSGIVTLLHEPDRRCGQVSFSADGTAAFTVAETLFIQERTGLRRITLGVYANLAPLSPDGRHAVYNDAGDQLWLLNCATGARRRITVWS